MKSVFIICSVRGASEEYRAKLESYVSELERKNIEVHLPHRDSNQKARVIEICEENADAIRNADEVHIFYSSSSQGTHFDMGVAFAYNKRLIVVENEIYREGKNFSGMIEEWAARYKTNS
jgi:nucleoside 2-deoxyribosyltransferase